MGDDDEFGDLYTDVLQPLTSSFGSQARQIDASMSSQSRPVDRDVNSNDEEILHGAAVSRNSFSNSNLALGSDLNALVQEKTLTETGARSERRGLYLNSDSSLVASRMGGGDLDSGDGGLAKGDGVKLSERGARGFNFMQEDDALNIIVEERDNKDDDLVDKDVQFTDKQENAYNAAEQNDDMVNFKGAGAVGEMGTEQMIPGLSGKSENRAGSNFEDDWESDDSEDDLRIVLNDNHGQMGMERMPVVDDEDDGEGEPLVIVADNGDLSHHPMMMEDQEWGGEEGGPGVDGERKELGDAAKASGGGGSNAAPTAVQPKIGYSNHMYHQPFHSQFKYVRPGAAPIPGPAPLAGRGRGDWRPAGVKGSVPIQKGPHPGYGMPAWGPNTAGRGYGSGLDFTLPSHKTIFEVDIDSFEEKPWRLPGIDVSNFFNFGLNEESWKGYCKQLEQLRLEKTMQSKIRVYESGRAEQNYDPDLPPELGAAVGIQDIPSENVNPGKADAGASDLGKGTGRGRPPVPIGRPIPVEVGSGERLPSIDTRRPRLPDSDSVIVVVCHSSTDDMAEQQDSDQAEEDAIDDIQQDDQDLSRHISHEYSGQKRDHTARRGQLNNTINHDKVGRHDDLYAVSEAPVKYHPDRKTGLLGEERFAKGRGYATLSKRTISANSGENQIIDDQNESLDSENGKQNAHQSSSSPIGSDGEQAVAVVDNANDISGMGDRNFDLEKVDVALDATNCDSLEDVPSMHAANKRKRILHVEQVSLENDDKEDSKAGRSSDNSEATGSCKERKSYEAEDEVHQDKYHPHAGNSKRTPVGDEDNSQRRSHQGRDEIRKHMAVKEREDHHSHRGGDPNPSLHRHMKSESTEWRKESDVSEGSWRWRDEDLHGRRTRVEDTRKREHGGEISSRNRGKDRGSERFEREKHHQSRSQLDSDRLRGSNHDQSTGSKQRGRGDNLITRNEKLDDLHNKRRQEGAHIDWEHAEKEEIAYDHREGSSRRKRERDDSSGQRKTDNYAKLKDDTRNVRQIEEQLPQKERGERHRDRDEWRRHKQSHEEILPRRERGETRPVVRNERPVEDKPWTSQSQGKDDYRGSGREYHSKDVGRHSDHLKRRNRVENESFPEHKGREDVYGRSNQDSADDKRAKYERIGSSDERVAYAFDTSRPHERRQEKVSRQSKESDSQDPSSLIFSKRNQDGYSGQISETVNPRGQNDTRVNLTSSRKHTDDASSDDEQSESRRGRSKLERWTSHKERDFSVSSSLKKGKDFTGPSMKHEEPPVKLEGNQQPQPDNKDTGGETDSANMKAVDNKHLDTVEKLKKRSERFKLPMPSEKEAMAIKKIESWPLPSVQAEIRPNSEIKSERPVRKRRWTGS